MAWNGKNESILGSTQSQGMAFDIAPTPSAASAVSTQKAEKKVSDQGLALESKPPVSPPPKNAWNGRNAKILGVKTTTSTSTTTDSLSSSVVSKEDKATVTKKVAVENIPIRASTPATDASSTTSSITKNSSSIHKNKEQLSPKNQQQVKTVVDDDKLSLSQGNKEDETSLTADESSSSAATNITPISDASPTSVLEGNVVTTKTTANNNNKKNTSSESKKKKGNSNSSPSDDKNSSAPATPTSKSTNNSGSTKQNNMQKQNNNPSKKTRSRSNSKSGGQQQQQQKGNHNNNNNNSNNPSGKQQFRQNGNGNNSGNKKKCTLVFHCLLHCSHHLYMVCTHYIFLSIPILIFTAATPTVLCTFFAQGKCNRGTSCTFLHDPSQVQARPIAPPKQQKQQQGGGKKSSTSPSSKMNVSATTFVPTKRVFDPFKAQAIKLAKEAQDQEDRSRFASTAKRITAAGVGEEKKADEDSNNVDEPPFFSIDVECIATGYGSCANGINDGCGNEGQNKEGVPPSQYNDRSNRYPGRVAMVDSEGNVLADIIIRPPNDGAGVTSYLTPLTGLTADKCLGSDAKSLEDAVATIKSLLPKNGILVGQAIDHDVEWLGLTPGGVDFDRMIDISDIFRQRMPSILNEAAAVLKKKEEEGSSIAQQSTSSSVEDKSSDDYLGFATRYRHFSLRHVCLNLLDEDIQSGEHNPITDAKYSLLLFHKYRNSSVTQLRIVRDGLHRAPITLGFAAEKTSVIDGVCVSKMGYHHKRAGRKIWRWYSSVVKK